VTLELPILGVHVAIDKGGTTCMVPGLGQLIGLVVLERDSREHVQYVTSSSDVRGLLARWDLAIGTKIQ
jgi:hypothetical protein